MFEKKVALVTGGAGHVGSAICCDLAKLGCDLVVADKNAVKARDLCSELQKLSKGRAHFLDINLSQPKEYETVLKRVSDEMGRLDFVVNNAAFYDSHPGWGVPFESESFDAWIEVMKVNLLAPFFLVQKLYPLLKSSPLASVVNISSIYGISAPDPNIYEGLPMTNPAAYGASKGGLIQMSKWLSTQLAPHVRVNCVTPGGIERGQDPTFLKRYEAKTPLGRMAVEQDVANAVTFLLSDKASYITGQNIVVDGGWTAW